ncbi:aminotransferase class-V domain-containing protein [Ditylenchus destructor]|uniref:Selenocysteine lyase n=1 Tax=Ditylenchus destructor TaxID=166010 RepID=A0AAD4N966_9BILA|nr:aminotransferase class-V domain-containing protein [Ditylenchus destructor]
MPCTYLDNNATTPLSDSVKQTIVDALDIWGNPSAQNEPGRKAKELVENARQKLSAAFNVLPQNVVFTSGGTEANNLCITSVVNYFKQIHRASHENENKLKVISSAMEHPSVLAMLEAMSRREEIDLMLCSIEPTIGEVMFLQDVKATPAPVIVSIMLANGETGVIQPIADLAEMIQQASNKNVFFHVDASQAVGKMKVDVAKLGADAVTIVGHKFYGPKIGALLLGNDRSREIFQHFPLSYGGGQEMGMRSGTENVPMIAGLGVAAKLVQEHVLEYQNTMLSTRNFFEKTLKLRFGPDVVINFEDSERLCNTSSVCFPNYHGTANDILAKCTTFVASTGAACHSDYEGPSPNLLACGLSEHNALRTIRYSIGRYTTVEDIVRVVNELVTVVLDKR